MKVFIPIFLISLASCGCISSKRTATYDIGQMTVDFFEEVESSQKNMCESLANSDQEYGTPACNYISDPFWNNFGVMLLDQAPKVERMIARAIRKEDSIIYVQEWFYVQTGETSSMIWNSRRGLYCFDLYPDRGKPRFLPVWGRILFSRLIGKEVLEKIDGIDFQWEKKNHHDLYLLGDPYSIVTKIKVSREGELTMIGSILM